MTLQKTFILFFFFCLSIISYLFFNSLKDKEVSKFESSIFEQAKDEIAIKYHDIFFTNYYKTIQSTQNLILQVDFNKIIEEKKFLNENLYNSGNSITLYNQNGEVLFQNDENVINNDLKDYINKPQLTIKTVVTNKGLYISNIIPLYKEKLIGILEVKHNFDNITTELHKENIKIIILLKENFSKDIQLSSSHSQKFIDNRYLVNKNEEAYYGKLLEQSSLLKKNELTDITDKKGAILIVKKDIDNVADAYIIKAIDDLDLSNKENIELLFNQFIFVSIVFFILFYILIVNRLEKKYLIKQNKKLENENKKLQSNAAELDYNEKKLANLFNLQPNIMMISNGKDIIQVNKRFMGFFRRFKSFENFKRKHKSISELFEFTHLPNYVTSGLIDGQNWLEYILQNPKKLYKTIISVDGEQHHFIIKVSEMDYVKNYQDRYIVVAFVDITQNMQPKSLIIDSSCEINNQYDITHLIENNISKTINQLTHIKPTKQSVLKAFDSDFDKTQFVSIETLLKTKNKSLNWNFLLKATTISYIQNIITSKYDEKISTIIDQELEETAKILVDTVLMSLINDVNLSNDVLINDLTYEIKKLQTHNEIIKINKSKYLFKFLIFIDNKEIDIFIDFDKESLFYVKQIKTLANLFETL